jgi:hypothetical protein
MDGRLDQVLFAVAWLATNGLAAHLGGWARLAKIYQTHESQAGEHFRFASAWLGHRYFFPDSCGNCLFITVNDSGIRLAIFPLLRFRRPPLFVPWEDVESVSRQRFLFGFWKSVVTIKGQWPRVSIFGKAGQAVHGAYLNRLS